MSVTVSLEDLRAVLQAADYMTNRSLRGPVDRLGDAVALATMTRDTPPGQGVPNAENDALRAARVDELRAMARDFESHPADSPHGAHNRLAAQQLRYRAYRIESSVFPPEGGNPDA